MARKNKNLITRHPRAAGAAIIIAGATVGAFALFGGDGAKPNQAAGEKQPVADTAKPGSKNQVEPAQGGAVDKKGSASSLNPDPVYSSSRKISLASPSANSVVRSGDEISGTAKVKVVQFRLVDNEVGVLAQGSLSVVNGRYAGALNFKPRADNGSLEVFSLDPKSGAEINRIEINIKLKS